MKIKRGESFSVLNIVTSMSCQSNCSGVGRASGAPSAGRAQSGVDIREETARHILIQFFMKLLALKY
jgi:hypothetical protein